MIPPPDLSAIWAAITTQIALISEPEHCRDRGQEVEVQASRAGEPVSFGAVLDGELVFVPGEVPRRGVFAHLGRGTGSVKVELVFPGGTYGIRKRLISADLIPLAEALPALVAVDASEYCGRPARR